MAELTRNVPASRVLFGSHAPFYYVDSAIFKIREAALEGERLKAIKDRYDPDGFFFVHHGVGSEDWGPEGFVRIA